MPELPDVEVFKRYLDSTALGTQVDEVRVRDRDLLEGVSSRRLRDHLEGNVLEDTHRHGKFLFVSANGAWLVLHFGMTGFLSYRKEPDDAPEHPRLVLDLANGYHLFYDCKRKFGEVGLVSEPEDLVSDRNLGPDALRLDRDGFLETLDGRGGSLKSFLMNQNAICGIGNVYSDEICFQAGHDPETAVGDLDTDDRRDLYRHMRHVLDVAIDRKVDIDAFPDSWLTPRREEGAPCPRCDGEIAKRTVSGRSAYLCPSHQR